MDDIGLALAFYVHFSLYLCWYATILDHQLQTDDQPDVYHALPYTFLGSSPIVAVLLDVPIESFEWTF